MDAAKHANGVVEVELYDAESPAGSIKALNPTSAAYANGTTVHTDSRGFPYTNGTCSNVYCHSYNEWTTPGGVAASMPCRTSLPPNLVTTRLYRQITWGGALPKDCTGCHASPPKTTYPSNDGGSGDSHMTINRYSEEELHSWNMTIGEPLSCTYCHNATVSIKNKVNRYLTVYNNITTVFSNYSAVPIANFSRHVNGRNDVAFDAVTPVVYQTSGSPTTKYLTNASYNSGNKTCSNVACHLSQTSVKWGLPYRWRPYTECDRCHQYAYQCP
jgi:predicted CxxxxCH...CXXCH cytochrome family protein